MGSSASPMHLRCDMGTGMLGSLLGVTAMLSFFLLACQLLIGLHATSVVQAVAFDAAQEAATSPQDGGSDTSGRRVADLDLVAIEGRARRSLGSLGDDAVFTWGVEDDVITLRVAAQPPGFLPASFSNGEWLPIDRTVVVRREGQVDYVE